MPEGHGTDETLRAATPAIKAPAKPQPMLPPWLRAQALNVTRHAAALRPFRPDEFGTGAQAPTAGHIQAVNKLITALRRGLLQMSRKVTDAALSGIQEPSTERLQDLMRKKAHAHDWVRGIERIARLHSLGDPFSKSLRGLTYPSEK